MLPGMPKSVKSQCAESRNLHVIPSLLLLVPEQKRLAGAAEASSIPAPSPRPIHFIIIMKEGLSVQVQKKKKKALSPGYSVRSKISRWVCKPKFR